MGIFTQIYTIYLIWSHFAVFGINDSAQRHIAYHVSDKNNLINIKLGALWIGFITGILFSLILYFIGDTIGKAVQSPDVGLGLQIIASGILFFTINKILLGILNGERKIFLYSFFQSLRSILILALVILNSYFFEESYYLAYSFVATELILFLFLLVPFLINHKWSGSNLKKIIYWSNTHCKFGLKSFPVGFLYESYLKIDIIMISIFLNDHKVGIYSFAAMFFEGVYQIPHLIKTNSNPILVSILKKSQFIIIDNFVKSLFLLSFILTSLFIMITVLVYPFLDPYFPDGLIQESYLILGLLFVGLFFYSGFIPFDFVFLQAGQPLTQTSLLFVNVLINICLNFVFIQLYGFYGAALSTSLTLIIAAFNLIILASYRQILSKQS